MVRKSFIGSAIILMIAGFIVRILGFVFRVYLSNLIGAEGMGLFQLIAPVYSLVILTLTSGISIAVSKTVAAELARGHYANLKRITSCALMLVMAAGIAVSALIYINIGFIANVVLKDSRTYYSLVLLIPCIPVVTAASAVKGYFYGMQDMVPTAVSQIIEQFVRIGLVIVASGYFVNLGLEYACAMATVGMALGEISNLLVLYGIYKLKRDKYAGRKSKNGLIRKRTLFGELLKISVPVSFNRFITSIMSAIENIMIPRRLIAGGLDYHQSMEEFGRLTGMAMPLLFFPSIVTSSLATTLVPAISEAISVKSFKSANYRISKSIQTTFILGFVFTAIFMVYPDEIGNIIYRKENIGNTLYLLSFTCVFVYLQQTLTGVLNGLGKQGISLRNSIIGYLIRIMAVYFLMPVFGLRGYIWGMIASTACVCSLNLATVVATAGVAVDIGNWIIKPGLIGLVLFLFGRYIYSFFGIFNTGYTLTVLLTLVGDIAVAVLLLLNFGILDKDELIKMIKPWK